MEHGNMAPSVSPVPTTVTENDMRLFSDLFGKIANAVTQASEMPAVIESLRSELSGLRSEIETVRRRNADLDEIIGRVREDRDRIQNQYTELERHANEGHRLADQRLDENRILQERIEAKDREINTLTDELRQARRERDDAGFKHLEVSEERDALKKDLAELWTILQPIGNRVLNQHVEHAKPSEAAFGDSDRPAFLDKPTTPPLY